MRAKQFMPFAALKGLPEALAERERIVVPKIELTEDRAAELNQKMQRVGPGQILTVVYFQGEEYLRVTGRVMQVDIRRGVLQVVDARIRFADIVDLMDIEGASGPSDL